MSSDEITSEDLIDVTRAAGFKVTARRLKRLRKEGLLPRPRQAYLAGIPGSRSLYPPECVDQLLTVCRVCTSHRSFDLVRLGVWWEGKRVEPNALRISLVALFRNEIKPFEELSSRYSDPEDAADVIAGTAPKSRHPFVRLLRDRIARRESGNERAGSPGEDLITVLHHLFVLTLGSTPVWTSPNLGLGESMPRDLMESALALDRAATDTFNGAGPWLEPLPSVPDLFSDLQQEGLLDPNRWLSALESASLEELDGARHLVRALTQDFSDVVRAIETIKGPDAFGWGHFCFGRKEGDVSAGQRVVLTAGCLVLRPLLGPEAVSAFVDALTSVAPNARDFLSLMDQSETKS